MLAVDRIYTTQDMFGAGTDTSSILLEYAMIELIRNPDIMAKVRDEITNNTPKGQEMVKEENLSNMSYLRAIIKETLRLYPPTPLLLPHFCMEDCEVNGYAIAAGTRVIVNAWALGRDAGAWERADEFVPERFLDGGGSAAADFRGRDFKFVPFGAGRRMCPGINFGMAVVELMLANLLYCFYWELPAGMAPQDVDMSVKYGLTSRRKEKLLLVPRLAGGCSVLSTNLVVE
jgi:cytochrome P450